MRILCRLMAPYGEIKQAIAILIETCGGIDWMKSATTLPARMPWIFFRTADAALDDAIRDLPTREKGRLLPAEGHAEIIIGPHGGALLSNELRTGWDACFASARHSAANGDQ
jgi:hypothetical protein